jgi:hypothetical protein
VFAPEIRPDNAGTGVSALIQQSKGSECALQSATGKKAAQDFRRCECGRLSLLMLTGYLCGPLTD